MKNAITDILTNEDARTTDAAEKAIMQQANEASPWAD